MFTENKFPRSFVVVASAILTTVMATGCPYGDPQEEPADHYVQGDSTHPDSSKNASGQPQQPANPGSQPEDKPAKMLVGVRGKSTLGGNCDIEGVSGNFTTLAKGNMDIGDDGIYLAALNETGASVSLPNVSCQLEIVVMGQLQTSTRNCNTYCEAKARSYAEGECGANWGSTSCGTNAYAEYAASCKTECTGHTSRRINAEISMGLTTLANFQNGLNLGVLLEGDLNLTYDEIHEYDDPNAEQGGTAVDETP